MILMALTYKTLQTGTSTGSLISKLEKLGLLRLTWLITGAIHLIMDGPVLEEKSSFKMLGLFHSSKLDCSPCFVSIA